MRHATPYGVFNIDPMPGNPQVALCSGFFVFPEHRGKGLGHRLKLDQEHALVLQGYDYAICTVRSDNDAQRAVLAKARWIVVGSFKSSQSGAVTLTFVKALTRDRLINGE